MENSAGKQKANVEHIGTFQSKEYCTYTNSLVCGVQPDFFLQNYRFDGSIF